MMSAQSCRSGRGAHQARGDRVAVGLVADKDVAQRLFDAEEVRGFEFSSAHQRKRRPRLPITENRA
jgi:hypothetical protein